MENGCLDIPETREATVYSSALIRASLLSVLLSCACDVMPAGYVPQHVLNLSLRLSLCKPRSRSLVSVLAGHQIWLRGDLQLVPPAGLLPSELCSLSGCM